MYKTCSYKTLQRESVCENGKLKANYVEMGSRDQRPSRIRQDFPLVLEKGQETGSFLFAARNDPQWMGSRLTTRIRQTECTVR